MDRSRVLGVKGPRLQGSGYFIARALAITSAHVVGEPQSRVQVFRPGDPVVTSGVVVWRGASGGRNDAALVLLDDDKLRSSNFAPVRWGRLVTDDAVVACETWGLPEVERLYDEHAEVAHLSGRTNSGTGFVGNRYVIDLDRAPEGYDRTSPWAGLSGAAVFSGDLLIGIIKSDLPKAAHRRLDAVPAYMLLRDPDFVDCLHRYGLNPRLEPVEFQALGELPIGGFEGRKPKSPSDLLRPDRRAVPFFGRQDLLRELSSWLTQPGEGVFVIHGEGGAGKTRLAIEFAEQCVADGYATLWLRKGVDPSRLGSASRPILIVVDYSETKLGQLAELLFAAANRSTSGPWKLLLLSRSLGHWWDVLRRGSAIGEWLLEDAIVRRLSPLTQTASERRSAYQDGVKAYTSALVLNGLALDGDLRTEALDDVDLSAAAYGNALTLQMEALTGLLDRSLSNAARPTVLDDQSRNARNLEDRLLRHEYRYWDLLADSRPSIALLTHQARADAVLVATLLGAVTPTQAQESLALVPSLAEDYDRRAAVAEWISELFPTSDNDLAWGSFLPDRLGERFAANRILDEPARLDRLVGGATDLQRRNILLVLTRASSHADSGARLASVVTASCIKHQEILAEPAADVACQVADARPLLDALHKIVADRQRNLSQLIELMEMVLVSFKGMYERDPEYSSFVTAILRAVVDRFHESYPSAETDLDEIDYFLIHSVGNALRHLALDLSRAGDPSSEGYIEEGMRLQGIVEGSLGRGLQQYLIDYSKVLVNLGRPEEGLAKVRDAVEYFAQVMPRDLAFTPWERRRYEHEHDHLLHHLAEALKACGHFDESAQLAGDLVLKARVAATGEPSAEFHLSAALFFFAGVLAGRRKEGDVASATDAAYEALRVLEALPEDFPRVRVEFLKRDLSLLLESLVSLAINSCHKS